MPITEKKEKEGVAPWGHILYQALDEKVPRKDSDVNDLQ